MSCESTKPPLTRSLRRRRGDRKVRDTIFAIIQEFFRVNNATMLYICETGDGKQAMRSRLFSHWFAVLADKGLYSILQSSVTDEEGLENYYAVITRKDNPFAAQVMTEFYATTYFFSHKPDGSTGASDGR